MEFLHFLGRFHILLLHLPIGFFFLTFAMELVSRNKENHPLKPAISFGLLLGLISTLLVAALGYLLSLEGGYPGSSLNWHLWSGISTTVLAVFLYLAHARPSLQKAYFPTFGLLMLSILFTGHLGGNLTHGEEFLFEKAPNGIRTLAGLGPKEVEEEKVITNIQEAFLFADFIQPILKKKCVSCHNPGKTKGKLLLNTEEGIKKGGKTGALFVAGNSGESLMMERIFLPLEEEKHMPPEGKKQLSKNEISLLEWWIESGPDFGQNISSLNPPEHILELLEKRVKENHPVLAKKVPLVNQANLVPLKEMGFQIYPIAQESPFLDVKFADTLDVDGSQLLALKGIQENIVFLDLSRTNITDEMLNAISEFPHLMRLRLNNTEVSNKGLRAISGLTNLEYLNIYGTAITDEGMQELSPLKRLQKVYVWQTPVTKEGIIDAQKKMPQLEIISGMVRDSLIGERLAE